MFLAGIPIRVGYAGKGKERILTHIAVPFDDQMHKADIYLNVLKAFGINITQTASTLSITEEIKQQVKMILERKGIIGAEAFVVVHTSGNWDLKRWPKENWASLIRILTNDLGIKVVISEGPKEVAWAHEIARRSAVDPVVLAGETNLLQLFALLEKASVVISADSGPLHIASCVSKNIVGLYGPTMPWTTGPRGLAQSVILHKQVGCNMACCYYQACPDNVCMKSISVSDVVSSVKEILEKENVGR